jgi:hypothetical protein
MSERVQTIRGRSIRDKHIQEIRQLLEQYSGRNRRWISLELCRRWKWEQPNGKPKDMAARNLLLTLQKQGKIELPAAQRPDNNHSDQKGERYKAEEVVNQFRMFGHEEEGLEGRLGVFGKAELGLMRSKEEHKFWDMLIHRYHYLGYRCIVGQSLKYLITVVGQRVGCIGWGAGLWKLGLRDKAIGWGEQEQQKNLGGIVNNVRFLIFPWVKIKYLASHVLSVCARKVPLDWAACYGQEASLLETLVDRQRFKGTCYKAANWIYLGQTEGKSKRGLSFYKHGVIKDYYVYPLSRDFRKKLRGET